MTRCPRCTWVYEDGSYHDCTDEAIGSELEYWLSGREHPKGRCFFCGKPSNEFRVGIREYCSERCRDDERAVFAARLAIGRRDLERRGFD